MFVDRTIRGVPIEISGATGVRRGIMFTSKTWPWLTRAVAYQGSKTVFNIGSGAGVSLNELIAMLGKILGSTIEPRYAKTRAFDVPANVLSNRLAKDELGWEPSIALEDGLASTVDWQRQVITREVEVGSGESG